MGNAIKVKWSLGWRNWAVSPCESHASRPEHEKPDIQELQVLVPNFISCVNLMNISEFQNSLQECMLHDRFELTCQVIWAIRFPSSVVHPSTSRTTSCACLSREITIRCNCSIIGRILKVYKFLTKSILRRLATAIEVVIEVHALAFWVDSAQLLASLLGISASSLLLARRLPPFCTYPKRYRKCTLTH